MPTYEYLCEKCGEQFDVFQSISDKSLTHCPKDKCSRKRWGKGKVKKLIGAGAGLLFKGSGFYTTDYRSENYKKSAKNESSAPKTTGSESKSSDSSSSSSSSSTSKESKTSSTKSAKTAKST